MTLTLELPSALAQRLQAEAQAHGQDVQAFALAVLERSTPSDYEDSEEFLPTHHAAEFVETTLADRLEAIAEFNQAAREMAPSIPILSTYATTREGIYEGYAEHLLRDSEDSGGRGKP